MCKILLGLIVDLRLPDNRSSAGVVSAVRALLDFLYISQYPSQTTTTLSLLDDALTRFHNDKDSFRNLGIRSDFNIPKLHSLQHYSPSIENFGTSDNYNTEYSERLHIDLAKDAYDASNHKDEYPQMTRWLERKEKIHRHSLYIQWRLSGRQLPPSEPPIPEHHTHIKMTKWPSVNAVPLPVLATEYGAHDFRHELTVFVAKQNFPTLTAVQLRNTARNIILPFQRLPVFHKIKFWNQDPHQRFDAAQTLDAAHVRPRQKDKSRNKWRPGCFDTVLVKVADSNLPGIRAYRVAQIRTLFRLPDKVASKLFQAHVDKPKHLVYVEWFTEFPNTPERYNNMYKITRSIRDNRRVASIVRVSDIARSVVLFPKFGPVAPREWTSSTVLEQCNTFYVNPFTDRHTHINMY